MRKNKETRKLNKVRRLIEEHDDIGRSAKADEEILRRPEVIRTGDTPKAHHNFRRARLLFEVLAGSPCEEGPYIVKGLRIGTLRPRKSGLTQISEEKYKSLPEPLPSLYQRERIAGPTGSVHKVPKGDVKRLTSEYDWIKETGSFWSEVRFTENRFTEKGSAPLSRFELKEDFQPGWEIRPGIKQIYFDPGQAARREEIERRVVEIMDMPFNKACQVVFERLKTKDDWTRPKDHEMEEVREQQMEEKISRAATSHLSETRGGRSYAEITRSAPREERGMMTKEEHAKAREAEERRRELKDLLRQIRECGIAEVSPGGEGAHEASQPDLQERLNGSAKKLLKLKQSLE
jgi:hypothetical protein